VSAINIDQNSSGTALCISWHNCLDCDWQSRNAHEKSSPYDHRRVSLRGLRRHVHQHVAMVREGRQGLRDGTPLLLRPRNALPRRRRPSTSGSSLGSRQRGSGHPKWQLSNPE